MNAQEKRLIPGNVTWQVTTDKFYPNIFRDDKILGELLKKEEWNTIPAGKYALIQMGNYIGFGRVMENSLSNEKDGQILIFDGEKNLSFPASCLDKVWACNSIVCRWLK